MTVLWASQTGNAEEIALRSVDRDRLTDPGPADGSRHGT